MQAYRPGWLLSRRTANATPRQARRRAGSNDCFWDGFTFDVGPADTTADFRGVGLFRGPLFAGPRKRLPVYHLCGFSRF